MMGALTSDEEFHITYSHIVVSVVLVQAQYWQWKELLPEEVEMPRDM